MQVQVNLSFWSSHRETREIKLFLGRLLTWKEFWWKFSELKSLNCFKLEETLSRHSKVIFFLFIFVWQWKNQSWIKDDRREIHWTCLSSHPFLPPRRQTWHVFLMSSFYSQQFSSMKIINLQPQLINSLMPNSEGKQSTLQHSKNKFHLWNSLCRWYRKTSSLSSTQKREISENIAYH